MADWMAGMKKTPLYIIIVGAALTLLSCSSGGGLYVTTPQGEPLQGVILEPVALTYGCKTEVCTGYCGGAYIPNHLRHAGLVNLKRVGFDPVYNLDINQPGPIHVVMKQTPR